MKRITISGLLLFSALLSFSSCTNNAPSITTNTEESSDIVVHSKTILISGFEPFGGDTINPTQNIVNDLPDKIEDINIHAKVLPVEFIRSQEVLQNEYDVVKPDAVIMLGQAGGRRKITPETTAKNIMNGVDYPDNAGYEPNDLPIVENGPDTLYSRLPNDKINAALNEIGVPAESSNDAGDYVCNCIMYSMLNYVNDDIPVGFIHVPFIPEQGYTRYPSMEYEKMYSGIIEAIKVVGNELA